VNKNVGLKNLTLLPTGAGISPRYWKGKNKVTRLERIQYLLGFTLLNLILLGVVPDLLSEYVKQNIIVGLITIAAIGTPYLLLTWVCNRFAKRSRQGLLMIQEENPAPRKGLIVFMSPGSRTTPAENAVKAHLPALEHCWIISGPDRAGQTPTSAENAGSTKLKFEKAKTTPIRFYLRSVENEDDPQQSYHLVRSIYEEAKAFGLADADVMADYTGGTKSMTAGMVLACSTSEERDAEYMKAIDVTSTGIASPSTHAVPVMIDLKFGSQK
jgi:hypothetical protein